jgi:acyl-homoserine lactone acylase PvdQ
MNKKKNLEEYSAGVNLYLKKRNVEILRNYFKLKKRRVLEIP